MTASSVYKAPKRKLEISFGGCGFLGVYHVGVGKCVVDHVPHLFDEFSGFYGASAGAITAVCAACKSDPMVPYKWVKKTFEASREHKLLGALHPSFNLYSRLRDFLEGFLPDDAHKLCRGKVRISLTTFDESKTLPEPKNWLVSNFTTRKELINAIIASSFIPGYAGLKDLPKVRGKRCCDGGFTSNIPCGHDPNVITVSPFSGECDICPQGDSHSFHFLHIVDQSLQLSTTNLHKLMKALVPTQWTELEDLFYSGYKDAYRFFKLEGIISESLIRPIRRRSTLRPSPLSSSDLTNGAAAVTKNNIKGIVEEEDRDDASSDYFSQSSDVATTTTTTTRHRRQPSITVSVTGDFFSCLDNDDDVEECDNSEVGGGAATATSKAQGRGGGGGGKVPTYLRSLWEEVDVIMKEVERVRTQEALDKQLSSSWSRLIRFVRRYRPTGIPFARSLVGGNRGNDPDDPESYEDSWDPELEDHPGLLHSIASSWSSSMTVM